MKRPIVLLVLFLLSIGLLSAQSYAPVYSSTKNFYNYVNSVDNPLFDHIVGLEIDSSKVINGDSVLYPFQQIQAASSAYVCVPLYDTSWAGIRILKNNDSTIFYNQQMEPIVFQHQIGLHAQWRLYTAANGDYITAEVVAMDTFRISATLDSVKVIELNWKDSNAQIITTAAIHQDTLLLSKHNGLLTTFSWFHFPTLSTNPAEHFPFQDFLTRGEVFDFDVNDEFHYSWGNFGGPPSYSNLKYLSKWYSANQDTVHYIRQYAIERNEVDFTQTPPIVTTYFLGQDTIFFARLNEQINHRVPTAPQLAYHQHPSSTYADLTSCRIITNTFNGRQTEERTENIGVYQADSSCYMALKSWSEVQYIKGCGRLNANTYDYSHGVNHSWESLTYFRKGNESWGTPRIITSLSEPTSEESNIQLYPNPATEMLQISVDGADRLNFQIFDQQGRLIIQQLGATNNYLFPVSNLPNGLYFFILQAENALISKKFLVSH